MIRKYAHEDLEVVALLTALWWRLTAAARSSTTTFETTPVDVAVASGVRSKA